MNFFILFMENTPQLYWKEKTCLNCTATKFTMKKKFFLLSIERTRETCELVLSRARLVA